MPPLRPQLSILACCACAALAGCGEKTIDTGKAEREIDRTIEEQTGAAIRSVACPDDVEGRKGDTFDCQATGADGTRATIRVTQRDDEGGIGFRTPLLHTGPAETQIAQQLTEKTDVRLTVVCPDLVLARAGTKLACRATDPDGKRYRVDVTVVDAQGNITFRLRP